MRDQKFSKMDAMKGIKPEVEGAIANYCSDIISEKKFPAKRKV